MTECYGYRVSAIDPEAVRREAERVTTTLSASLGESVTVLIDTHYPYHPSSGMVTNPAVVAGVIDHLRLSDRSVSIVPITPSWSDTRGCLEYLGYDSVLDTRNVTIGQQRAESTVSRTVHIGERDVIITIPESLLTDVLCVPTLRPGSPPSQPCGSWLLAQAALEREPTEDECIAFGACIEATGLLDATYSMVETPRRTKALFASDDVAAIDHLAATFQRGPQPAVVSALQPKPPRQIGLDPREIADPVSESAAPTTDSGLMAKTYRAYARVSGDLLPPQLLHRHE